MKPFRIKTSVLAFVMPLVLVVTGILVYFNSFNGEFLFDDGICITDNQEIRTLLPPWGAMFGGIHHPRPVAGLSFAINYAISGLEIWSYHLVNLVIHLVAGLALYGIVVITLWKTRFKLSASLLALVISLIWLVHPLQTEAVTYITQRYESLMGMFFLLSVLCYVMTTGESVNKRYWQAGSILFCLLAIGSKQVAVVIPIIVLLYDRTFVTRSFKATVLNNGRFLGLLFASWIPLVILQLTAEPFDWAGFDMEVVTPWKFAISEFGVIVHYLRLAFWPDALTFDYFWQLAATPLEVIPYLLLILILLALAIWGVVRNHPFGLLGLAFFLILAPTSSIMPLSDLAADHRMYLPLAPVIIMFMIGFYQLCLVLFLLPQRTAESETLKLGRLTITQPGTVIFLAISLALVITFGTLTVERNQLYASKTAIWKDTIAKAPHNPRAYANYGNALIEEKRYSEALPVLQQALALKPNYSVVLINLGFLANLHNDPEQAIYYWKKALEASPHERTFYNLALLYLLHGQKKAATHYFEGAVQKRPLWPPALIQLARLYAVDSLATPPIKQRALALAITANQQVQAVSPFYLDTLASAYAANGQFDQAIPLQKKALELAGPFQHPQLMQTLIQRLNLYENHLSYFEPETVLDITVRYPR